MRVSALPELQAYPPSFSPPPKAAMEAREFIRVRLHVIIRAVREVHRRDARMVFQSLDLIGLHLDPVHIELGVREASDFT
jgi:hypothetical protein